MTDSRLFNQESLSAGYGDEDSYNLYDKRSFRAVRRGGHLPSSCRPWWRRGYLRCWWG